MRSRKSKLCFIAIINKLERSNFVISRNAFIARFPERKKFKESVVGNVAESVTLDSPIRC